MAGFLSIPAWPIDSNSTIVRRQGRGPAASPREGFRPGPKALVEAKTALILESLSGFPVFPAEKPRSLPECREWGWSNQHGNTRTMTQRGDPQMWRDDLSSYLRRNARIIKICMMSGSTSTILLAAGYANWS